MRKDTTPSKISTTSNTMVRSVFMMREYLLGIQDLFYKPNFKKIWGGAFNGQKYRKQIFEELFTTITFSSIIETGTYKGNTTALMSTMKVPIFSVENDVRNFSYSRFRFFFDRNIHIYNNDSRIFLKNLAHEKMLHQGAVFFYLDAHWGEDLPLAEELNTIFSNWNNVVIMIDDFAVPNTAYKYDDYGEGKALNLDYLKKNNCLKSGTTIFFPAKNETHETSRKRGCVVLTNSKELDANLSSITTLTKHDSAILASP